MLAGCLWNGLSIPCVWYGGVSLLRINTNPLNIRAHVCINGLHRCTATRPYKEIRCQESWMTLFFCQLMVRFVDNLLMGIWWRCRKESFKARWCFKNKANTVLQFILLIFFYWILYGFQICKRGMNKLRQSKFSRSWHKMKSFCLYFITSFWQNVTSLKFSCYPWHFLL